MNSIPFFNYTHERSIPFRACDFFDELVARFASNPEEFDGKSNQLFSRPHIQELAEELLNMVSQWEIRREKKFNVCSVSWKW